MATRLPILLTLLLLAGAGAVSRGQVPADLPPGQVSDPPVFRAEIRFVEVDVFVTDRDGEFVRDLTLDDFELYEGGERQEVSTFQLVDLPLATRTSEPAAFTTVVPDVTTNAGEGRIYVLLLDASRPPGAVGGIAPVEGAVHAMFVQRLARQFVEEAVGPGDLVVVLHAQGGPRQATQGFTGHHDLLLASIDGFGPAGLPATEAMTEHETRQMRLHTYDAIRDLSERLGAVGGRRKAIVWIGGDVPFEDDDANVLTAYRDAIRAATRNNVAIYPVDPRGLTTELGLAGSMESYVLDRMAALRMVAEDTGGLAVVNTNNISGGYERIVRDNSTYYLLGYYPSTDHRDGRFLPIQVRVARPGLTVRARPGYYARDPDAEARRLPPLPEGLSTVARDALRSPAPTSGLTIDLLTTPFRGEGRNGAVLLAAQLRGADLRLDGGERIELAFQAFDRDGRVAAGERKAYTLTFGEESRALVEQAGLRYLDRVELPAGRYEIRFVAHQPDGATGSVVAHVEVPDFTRDPVALSGLVLTSAGTAWHRTLFGDPELAAAAAAAADALVALPTPVRRFPAGDELALFAEVYVNGGVRADDLRLVTRITSDAGDLVYREEEGLAAPAGDRIGYARLVSLEGLPEGRYVLALDVHRPGGRTPVLRQVPFTIAGVR